MRIIDHDNCFHVYWEFDHWHKRNLAAVKSIPAADRRYISDKKFWWVNGSCRTQNGQTVYLLYYENPKFNQPDSVIQTYKNR